MVAFLGSGGRGGTAKSQENLGVIPSLVAGSSLLVDYILTVAVSVAGGVLAIRTATGLGHEWAVPLCLICVAVMTLANLRGLKESGALFAGPTYFYVVMLIILIGTGFYRIFVQHVGPIPESMLSEEAITASKATGALSLYMLLRAFSSGAVALSGVEAVSNGVPAKTLPELIGGATPRSIREHLGLNKPIYARTAAYGHFGRQPDNEGGFSWERTDLVPELLKLA